MLETVLTAFMYTQLLCEPLDKSVFFIGITQLFELSNKSIFAQSWFARHAFLGILQNAP